ncbi:MAG: von Willebrand factor type domain, partial [Chthoniobacteraceae bacterium]|nr:von Willebrand factor type domain [Chthoniobacteraceae bacterium]
MLSASTSPRPPATLSSSRTNSVVAFIATTRFITISLLIHFVLIIVSGSFVLFKGNINRTDFVAGGDGFILTAENAFQTPKEDLIAPDVKPEAASTPPSLAPAIGAITSAMTQTAFTMTSPALGGAGIEGIAKLNAPSVGTIGLGTLGSRAGGSAMRMFGVQSKANSIVVCLDVSSSMITGEKSLQTYEVLEKEVIKVIRDLSSLARFGVVVFSKDAQTYRDVLVRATNEEKDKAVNFIKKLAPMQARNPKASVEEQEFHHGT